MRCIWTIRAPPNYRIRYNLVDIQTETCDDYVEIFDGKSVNDSLITKLCSSASSYISAATSSSNFVTIRFISDASNNLRGFLVNYTAIKSGEYFLN
jgi:hypothetical protein